MVLHGGSGSVSVEKCTSLRLAPALGLRSQSRVRGVCVSTNPTGDPTCAPLDFLTNDDLQTLATRA